MSVANLYFGQPIVSYVRQGQGLYRTSRVTRSAMRWAVLCEDVLKFSKDTVEVLKTSATLITVTSLLFLVPRIQKTAYRIWRGVNDEGIELTTRSFCLEYAHAIGDISKVSLIIFYKIPSVRLAANGAHLYIYGERLIGLGNRYIDISARQEREDDRFLTLEIARTIACITYSALRIISIFLGAALLSDAAFLSIMCLKQFMHFGSHYYQEIYNPAIPDA